VVDHVTEELDAVVFDAGKTLWDFKHRPEVLFAEALSRQGVTVDPAKLSAAVRKAERRFDEEFSGLQPEEQATTMSGYERFFAAELGVKVDHEKFAKDCREIFHEATHDVGNWTAYPDAVPTLEALRARGFKLGMISNASDLARKVLRNLDMERRFDFVVISSEVGVNKPSPEIFHLALRQAKIHPHRAVYVGDRLNIDVKGARRAGMQAVLLDREDIYPDADAIRIRDLKGLTRFL
jgi:putative hydrolase of the HAD superfamily